MEIPDDSWLCLDTLDKQLTLEQSYQHLRTHIVESFSNKYAEHLDFEEYDDSYTQFCEWLHNLLDDTPLPKEIEIVIMGLFPTEDGLDLFLCGKSKPIQQGDAWWETPGHLPHQLHFATLDIFRDLTRLHDTDIHAAKYIALCISVLYLSMFCQKEEQAELLLAKKGLLSHRRDELCLGSGIEEDDTLYMWGTLSAFGIIKSYQAIPMDEE